MMGRWCACREELSFSSVCKIVVWVGRRRRSFDCALLVEHGIAGDAFFCRGPVGQIPVCCKALHGQRVASLFVGVCKVAGNNAACPLLYAAIV
jgi:hypothetical protein